MEGFLKQVPLSSERLLNIVKQPIFIAQYDASGNYNLHYMLNSFIKIKGNSFNIIMHLRNENKKPKRLSIMNFFIISNSLSEKYENNPVRLFLACLDNYGLNLNINGKIKKIFAFEKIVGSEESLESFNFLSLAENKPPDSYAILTHAVYENKNTMLANFTYGVNRTKYMKYLQELLEP